MATSRYIYVKDEELNAKLNEEDNVSSLICKLLTDYYNSIKPSADPKVILEDLKCKAVLIAEEKEIMDKKVKEIEDKEINEKIQNDLLESELALKRMARLKEDERWRSLTEEQKRAEKPHLFS